MLDVVTAAALGAQLSGFRYDLTTEDSIQRDLAFALARRGFRDAEREVRLSATDRLDFLVGGVAIEVKLNGSVGELLRQLSRYAAYERVRELLVVTARLQLSDLPNRLHDKPLACLVLFGSIFG